jgi:hypothetical protein
VKPWVASYSAHEWDPPSPRTFEGPLAPLARLFYTYRPTCLRCGACPDEDELDAEVCDRNSKALQWFDSFDEELTRPR